MLDAPACSSQQSTLNYQLPSYHRSLITNYDLYWAIRPVLANTLPKLCMLGSLVRLLAGQLSYCNPPGDSIMHHEPVSPEIAADLLALKARSVDTPDGYAEKRRLSTLH